MHFDAIVPLMVHLAGTAVGAFVLAVIIDNVLGVVLAIREKAFDWNKLPSFLSSQFGTRQAVALFGLIAAAYVSGGDIHAAALAALAAGGGAMTIAVSADALGKAKSLVGLS